MFLSSPLWQINRAPSFGTDQKIDYDVKKGVLLNALKLLNIRYRSPSWLYTHTHACLQTDTHKSHLGAHYSKFHVHRQARLTLNLILLFINFSEGFKGFNRSPVLFIWQPWKNFGITFDSRHNWAFILFRCESDDTVAHAFVWNYQGVSAAD